MGIPITTLQAILGSRLPMVFTVDPSKAGVTPNHFKLPLVSVGSYDFTVDWGDNSEPDHITAWNDPKIDHAYGDSQPRTIKIRGRCSRFAFNDTGDKLKIIDLQKWGRIGLTSMSAAFWGCANLIITADDHADARFHAITDFYNAFRDCVSLTTPFPAIDTSNATNFIGTWYGCSKLTSFPALNTSNVYSLQGSWTGCSGLTSFPWIDTSKVTIFFQTWYGCSKITGTFPAINTSKGTNFDSTWRTCSKLKAFPWIDTGLATTFKDCWNGCTDLGLESGGTFPLISAPNATNFWAAWYNCSQLTSFPTIVLTEDPAKSVEFQQAWAGCYRLTSFPAINTVRVNSMHSTWSGCTGLTAFPSINTSNVTNFSSTWNGCIGLTSFPALNTSQGTNFLRTWQNCHSLHSVMPIFDMHAMTNGDSCFPTLSTAIYNSILDQLANGRGAIPANPNNSVAFGAANSKHDETSGGYNGTASRLVLTTAPRSWTITDGGHT